MKALKYNKRSIIRPNATNIRSSIMIRAVSIVENQAPKVVPMIIYAVNIRLNTDTFINV